MFNLPSYPQQRHWKVRLQDGTWKNIKRTIKNEKELLIALRLCGGDWKKMDIFASTSRWLDGENIKKRNDHDILLGSDFVLDVDDANLEMARQKALMVYGMMQNAGYTCTKIVFSGSKGYHLYYELSKGFLNSIHPYYRISALKTLYQVTLTELGIPTDDMAGLIDQETTLDPYRVIRLPGSINQKSGKKCTIIAIDDLKMPAIATGRDNRGTATRAVAHEANPPRQPHRAGEQPGISSRPTFISNRVSGTSGLYILILKYPLAMSYLAVLRRVTRLIDTYKLSDFYIFKNDKWYYAINLAAFQARRLQKLIRLARSETTSIVSYFPTNCRFVDIIKGEREKTLWFSSAHTRLYSILTKAVEDKERKLCGELKIEVMRPNG